MKSVANTALAIAFDLFQLLKAIINLFDIRYNRGANGKILFGVDLILEKKGGYWMIFSLFLLICFASDGRPSPNGMGARNASVPVSQERSYSTILSQPWLSICCPFIHQ